MNTATMISFVIAQALVVGCNSRAGSQTAAALSQTAPPSAVMPTAAAAPRVEESPIPRPPAGSSLEEDPKAIAAVKERGARTAAADIKAGKLRILEYGASRASTDVKTGLPTLPIPCCDMTGQVSAETAAYNQVIRDWRAKHIGSK